MSENRRIAISSDHAGVELRKSVAAHVAAKGWEAVDVGPPTAERTDYPRHGETAARLVQSGDCRFGIVICGTGAGISLAANKLRGIRCVLCSEPFTAAMARAHNDANMLAFGARVVGPDMALMIVDHFLAGAFEGGRHRTRVDMLMEIETREHASEG